MKAIVGLGNPGVKYSRTKHNAGFMVLDNIAKEEGLVFRSGFRGQAAEAKKDGERIFYLKPQTYMNLSGLAAAELVNYYKIAPQDILVIHDDMDLPLGRLRLRSKGSAGGHNGIKSLIAELGIQDFWRLKIGVGRPKLETDVVDHVLTSFAKQEAEIFEEAIIRAVKVSALWCQGRQDEAMNLYNRE
ncbi:aminoacyl-tRNA hydrolase [Dehalobacter sp. DCM]|uniref:aminoacyl-tRNA hydrolase n=1 Tax=Dehalobacter sp. DCM TaxID=2907827 RepID=UPI003081A60F|nr:aminoacyl-tRNA hydrolase [Dehalobacter sp. DCM]